MQEVGNVCIWGSVNTGRRNIKTAARKGAAGRGDEYVDSGIIVGEIGEKGLVDVNIKRQTESV